MTDGFVILVEFTLKPGALARFKGLALANATASVRDEGGCRRFDVLLPRDASDRVAFYEIYDNPEAFEAHLATPHFAAFRDGSEPLVEHRVIGHYDLREHA